MPRTPNNPNTSQVIMIILKNIISVNTYLAQISTSGTGVELVYAQQKYKMALGMTDAIPYAVNMSSGSQERVIEGERAYSGTTDIEVAYYSKWNNNISDIDAIWATMDDDLERIAANIESNDATDYGGTNHTLGLAKIAFDPYEGTLDVTFPQAVLIKRALKLTYNILPYGS